MHDRETGDTEWVSHAGDGGAGDLFSNAPSLSADGRYVAFDSASSNLVEGDTNDWTDVFLHDRETGETRRVSVASDGTEGDHLSSRPTMSPDGRFVGYLSLASNLVAGDGNASQDAFVWDRMGPGAEGG